ncbi:flagellar hook-length control protein FliK [Pseudomonas phytophila]|uniref:Flagellar hook-length control protein FliK n=1 Tax=Pseudomonas phytophila TaxID=2867264 RepID=A0ABY6FAC2_9PSED|nr:MULTISPECIES: flagellar hook-length control protein FliK [Pseudomonas]MCD5990578.1 flagellar hook-length control protein FliK [Pseudomonas quasicaspiana]PHN33462.1 flagellar hook-length control protein FliK [Pseudomonas sp. ICMP 561]UXZ94808.1 flagellar hook-length control protein FliK [Pseudomonas phytophila]
MTGDITSLQPTTAAAALGRAGLSPAQVLQLLQPMENLIKPGETVAAEVITLKQLQQNFQLLIKIALGNGLQTSVSVTSPLPLTPGTTLSISQASPNALTMTLQQVNTALNNLQTSIDTEKLPQGTLLQARVLTTQVVADAVNQLTGLGTAQPGTQSAAQPALYKSIVVLLNTALAGTSLSIESPQPLRPGSLLSAQVQGSQSLNFVPLPSNLDQLAVTQQLTTQQNRQGSLDVLINALRNLQPPPSTSSAPSTPLQASIQQLLADLPDMEQMSNPRVVAQAINASGLFMEAKLLSGMNPMAMPDMKANLMQLIAQLLPGLPANTSYDAAAASNMLARTMPGVLRSALGTMGLVAPPPLPVHFPLPSRAIKSGKEDDLEILLKLAAAAVSRVQSHQLGSLEQTRTNADGTQVTAWQLEIPMRNGQDIVPMQVKIQREDMPEKDSNQEKDDSEPKDVREKLWKIDLAFDLTPLGALQVQAQLHRGKLSSQLWAERADSAALISNELGYLRERLIASGLEVGELACSQGVPHQGPRTTLQQRWIDENA